MTRPIDVQIIGAPVCAQGRPTSWRSVATYVAQQLALRFGERVRITYADLFDPGCPPLPEGAQLPLVLVDGAVLSSGGKIQVPLIRQAIEARLGSLAPPAQKAAGTPTR